MFHYSLNPRCRRHHHRRHHVAHFTTTTFRVTPAEIIMFRGQLMLGLCLVQGTWTLGRLEEHGV